MDGLRSQPQVAHDRDARSHHPLYRGQDGSALKLHRLRAALLHEAPGVAQGLLRADRVAEEGHVPYHQRVANTPADRFGVVDHFVHRDTHGRIVP